MDYFLTQKGEEELAYKSLMIKDPTLIGILSNELTVKIIEELANMPACSLDIARKMKIHEQKVYYHIRKLEKAGIIRIERTEERVGGTAKIYSIVAPIVSLKLCDRPDVKRSKTFIEYLDFFKPFIIDGKLDAKIIVGDPYQHGEFDATARDTPHAVDLAVFFGVLSSRADFPSYLIDTRVREEDLKNNIILIGGPKINIITHKINDSLPIYFDIQKEFNIVSRKTGVVYKYDYDCVVERIKNPFSEEKEILLIAGKRSAGTKSGVIAITKNLDQIIKESPKDRMFARVVSGVDRDGDGIVDSVKFLE